MDDLARELRALHQRAGAPSTRRLAAKAGLSHTTVADILRGEGRRVATILSVVRALGGDEERFVDLLQDVETPTRAPGPIRPGQNEILLAILDELRAIRALHEADRERL